MKTLHLFTFIFSLFILSGCKLVDLQTSKLKETGLRGDQIALGHTLLENAWKAQGMDKLHQFSTYSVIAEDHWKGLMGNMGKVWPDNRSDLALKYAIGTFDSQVTFLNGKKEGVTAGLQSWKYYERENDKTFDFKDKPNERIRFGLAAFQYFFELGDRLKRAPIVTALDSVERDGVTYNRVFVTWEKPEAHIKHDQYRLWINAETHLIEFAEFTIRDTYLKMPGSKAFYGSIHFSDFRDTGGVKIPFMQHIFINGIKKDDKYLHRLTVSEFLFDSFDIADLRPNPEIQVLGDLKVE